MSLSENDESLWGADSGVAANASADQAVPSESEAMSGIARRRADKPPAALLNALSRRSIESGGVFLAL